LALALSRPPLGNVIFNQLLDVGRQRAALQADSVAVPEGLR
jgi:hypothetical protein